MVPEFAIVGHPNKGKSSIVSTLAQDESVQISPLPGTTIEDRTYPMVVDGQTLYRLVDTPGFQRARAALEWMQGEAGSPVERPQVVQRFVEAHLDDHRFDAECALLAPVLEGAGILYVVDGSRPFGEEYEAEMEILRWTGQPSLALINMIGDADYSEQWQNALGQYFRIVRVFDAMTADFDRRVQLLQAFGQIRESWREPLGRAVQVLQEEQRQRRSLSARMIAETLSRMISHTVRKRLPEGDRGDAIRAGLQVRYREDLAAMEKTCRDDIERTYNFRRLQRHDQVIELLDADLFAKKTWRLFGLTREQLIATGGVGGALAGSVIDVAVGGTSLLMGAGVGALIGGASAWLTAEKVADIKALGLPLGGEELSIGPMKSINFPYVVLGRALLHHRMIEGRTHAHREPLELKEDAAIVQSVDGRDRKRFEQVFSRIRKQDDRDATLVDQLAECIEPLFGASNRNE